VCAQATAGDVKGTFNLPQREYRGDEVSLEMGLKLSPIELGVPVQFALHLDGTPEDVCGPAAQEQSVDTFAAGTGVTSVQKDKFHYTIHYHMHYRLN
jgi:hypothetical protein